MFAYTTKPQKVPHINNVQRIKPLTINFQRYEQNNNFFVYGTLMYPFKIEQIINRIPKLTPATLYNYKRFQIKNKEYPGIIESPCDKVEGIILWEITKEESIMLDFYEGREYEKKKVECIAHLEKDIKIDAISYVYKIHNNMKE